MRCVILVSLFGSVLAGGSFSSRDQMARTPPPMQGFDPSQAMGKWYVVYAVNPDSWRGADKYTDWYQYFGFENNAVTAVDVWRKPGLPGQCSRATFSLAPTGEATFVVDHSIGGGTSGNAVLVDTDYVSYLILRGCTKPSSDPNICDDFYFHVKTRTPFPSSRTLRAIDGVLRRLWDVTTADIVQIRHGNPCRYPDEPDYYQNNDGPGNNNRGRGGDMRGPGGPPGGRGGGMGGPGGPRPFNGPNRGGEPNRGPFRGGRPFNGPGRGGNWDFLNL